ncbi:MAG: FtsH protease activity modulator HflK [Pseudomonadota bacterium]
MPWNDNSGNRGPWGQAPRPPGGGNNGAGGQPPDLEEILRQGQQRIKRAFPGGGGRLGGGAFGFIGLVVLGLWLFTGVYQVEQDELGVVTRFGQFVAITQPGLKYHMPYPIESVQTPKVTTINEVQVGITTSRRGGVQDMPGESLMLTGDENIVDIDFEVFWQIDPRQPAADGDLPGAAKFLFLIDNPEGTVKAVAEASMREVIGRNDLEPIITRNRGPIQDETRTLMQEALDEYDSGIFITEVNIQKADPPDAVIEAFRDVVNAAQDKNTAINTATAYSNEVVPRARGDAQRILEEARAYSAQVTAEARGQADRFTSIRQEYEKAPDVTRQRMYLETMERVLNGSNKIILDDDAGSGVVPYLPLPEVQRRRQGQ